MRKSDLIGENARLQGELEYYRGIVDTAGPYLDLAHDLQERVIGRLSMVGQEDLDRVLANIISECEDELITAGIEAKIEALPPERLLGMYATLLGDESVQEPLKRLAEIERRNIEREARLATIKQKAVVSGQFDFRDVEVGEVIELGLFRPDYSIDKMSYDDRPYAGRQITARMRNRENSTLQVLNDKLSSRNDSIYRSNRSRDNKTMENHQLAQIGTIVNDGNGGELEPLLTHGTEVAIKQAGEEVQNLSYKIGYVTIGDIVIIG